MVLLTVLAFAIAFFSGIFIIRMSGRSTSNYADDKPQRFHAGHVPRLGGVAVSIGMAAAWIFGALVDGLGGIPLNLRLSPLSVMLWLLVLLPSLITGVVEDLTQQLPVSIRLFATLTSAILACWLLGLSVVRLDLAGVDPLLNQWPCLGVVLAVVAIAGLPHAFNIIDGYNGLAGTVAMLISLAIAHVSLQVGDRALAGLMMAMAGSTAGFLVWNYPRGLIFAGDGGAYLWGGVVAIGGILLVQRNAAVSPWFPLLLSIYPVWETIFSIYRKSSRGISPGVADALHFHQLIFRRLVRKVFHDDHSRQLLIRNNRTSPYLWGFTVLTVLPAVLFWKSSFVLMACCGLFVVAYVFSYLAIVRFKIPSWLRR